MSKSRAIATKPTLIRKSPSNRRGGNVSDPSVLILQKDAFDFLAELEPGSIDLIITSPPYCMGKEYEKSVDVADFVAIHEKLAPLLVRCLRNGGSLCWQVGNHVNKSTIVPLDAIVYSIFSRQKPLLLRNRIIWTFGHGVHANRRFSGRHETVLWFTKGDDYEFNLDAVRVPQRYPGKRHYKGPKKGKLSGNPKGKNPSDVWDIPNVKANHVEKTLHPCQFPVALVQRFIRALVKPGGRVADPFLGSGTTAVASILENCHFVGSEIKNEYVAIAQRRVAMAKGGVAIHRPVDRPIFQPRGTERVAQRPAHFLAAE